MAETARFQFAVEIEMDHLPYGVNTGIRAARTRDTDGLMQHYGHGAFQFILNRMGVFLRLPPGKRRSKIFHRESKSGHAPNLQNPTVGT